jgi:ubiquinone/menaquinone biosynthesis C-methylase UbiE
MLFFHHFYHRFAWTYDFVAAAVSVGRWNRWIQAVTPLVLGESVLEIGFGPGHLQEYMLAQTSRVSVGIDESGQMASLARRRLIRTGHAPARLARALAQYLPFAAGTFDSVVSTFPSEYIFDDKTLSDVWRVLRPGGSLIVAPAAWIVGHAVIDRGAAWLFRVTQQAPPALDQVLSGRLKSALARCGFAAESRTMEIAASVVLVIIARRLDLLPAAE